jgi:signal peptidase I
VIGAPREVPAARGTRGILFGPLLTLPLAVLVIAVVLPFTTFVVASWLLGWQLQPVLTASMTPTYPVGSLLVVESIDASQVRPGMAVTFDDPAQPGRLVTHRVISQRVGDTFFFDTQGDANVSPDPFPVPARSIRGRVMWDVPLLGYAVDFLRWPRGFILLVVIPGLALATTEAFALRRRRTPVALTSAST